MRSRNSKPTDGIPLTGAAPAWAGWLFFLVGVSYLAAVYGTGLRPEQKPNGWHFFKRPNNIDLWTGSAIAVVAFTGAGASMLTHHSLLKSRRWNERQKATHPNEPWKWRVDWAARRIQPEKRARKRFYFAWAVLCVLSGFPGLEYWNDRGRGWPSDLVSYMGLGAVTVGVLFFFLLLRAVMKAAAAPQSQLHLKDETGVLGGPLWGAIEYPAAYDAPEYLIRFVCEKHWISDRKNSDGGRTRSLEISPVYEDTYRSSGENGLIPVRFAIPFDKPETTTDGLTPVHFWMMELEDLHRKTLVRFCIPVFKTAESKRDFELRDAAADRLITEETPHQCLRRYGIAVSDGEDLLTPGRTSIWVPAGQAASLGLGLGVFGVICLVVAAFMLPKMFAGKGGFGGAMDIFTGLIFGGVFGMFGLLMTTIAIQSLFERRRIELTQNDIRVRRSYFGFGWTTTIPWKDINAVQLKFSGSVGGKRREFKNVVAETDGMLRRDGTMMIRRRSIVNCVPSEAAEALQTIIESMATNHTN